MSFSSEGLRLISFLIVTTACPPLLPQSLFKTNVRKDSHFKKRTESHIAAPNPVFDEEFQFDLNPLWKFQTDFRLYAAVVALDPTLSSGL